MTTTTDRQRATWFRMGYPDQQMRVSDAERTEVADRLARHYADGRLDQAEFDERVSRAMAAKTVGDFQGLFDDLPDLPTDTPSGSPKAPNTPPPGYAARQPGRRRPRSLLGLVVLILIAWVALHVVAAIAWSVLFGWGSPVMWIALAVLIVVAAKRFHRSGR
jgi:hypothetical protein